MSERTYWRAANGDMQWTAPHHEGSAESLAANPRWQKVHVLSDADLAAHDAQVRAEALREYAALVEEIATLGPQNTGLRTPEHLAEYTRNYADRIESEARP